VAGENVAEAAVMLSMYGDKLFHLHFNDNYRFWDDDMIVGSVHFVEYVELLFWRARSATEAGTPWTSTRTARKPRAPCGSPSSS
jgi:hypothetical protein